MPVVNVVKESLLPLFGELKKIWLIEEYACFQVLLLKTCSFDETLHAYCVEHADQEVIHLISTDDLVDFNVLHLKKNHLGKSYIPAKYHLNDIMEEFLKDTNPLQQ